MNLSDYPKKKTLKDKTEVILRPLKKEDKDELLNFSDHSRQEKGFFLNMTL